MIEQVDAGWSVREFHGLDLGDARLNRRLLALAETFGAQPTAPINQANADWYATKAAYAFFAIQKRHPRNCWPRIRNARWNGCKPTTWCCWPRIPPS
jgi:Transposase DNA-binding